jgi:hypothetical protein
VAQYGVVQKIIMSCVMRTMGQSASCLYVSLSRWNGKEAVGSNPITST